MLRNSVTFRKVRWAFGYLLAAMFEVDPISWTGLGRN